jgi:stage V sporulation protein SpoVS
MLNLLPKVEKKKITREYRVRFLVVAFSLCLAGEVISLILLVPSYLTAWTRLYGLNSQSASLKAQNVTSEITQLSATIKKTSDYLNALSASSTPSNVAGTIKNIVVTKGSSVKINNLVYGKQGTQQQVVVYGIANTRQSLLDFIKDLKAQPGIISADLPVSDFAQSKDINFSVTVLAGTKKI